MELTYTITGTRPLIFNNGAAADPLNPLVKASKEQSRRSSKNRTDADEEQIMRNDWMMRVYADEQGHPVIPADMLMAVIQGGARLTKRGKQASAAIFVAEDAKLIYDGPDKVDALINDPRFTFRAGVKQQQARIFRTRPIFRDWSATINVRLVNPNLVDATEIKGWLTAAGAQTGIGDWRPRFGLFSVS